MNTSDRTAYAGVILVPVSVIFTARLVFEQTVLAWTRPAQMSGFSGWQFPMDRLGAIWLFLSAAWAICLTVRAALERRRIPGADAFLLIVLLACAAAWCVPFEDWQILTARVGGPERAPKYWLVSAAANGETRLLDYLLARGADVNGHTPQGQSALGAAAAAGEVECASRLMSRGASLNDRLLISADTPLIEAAEMNHIDTVSLLLKHGADPAARNAFDLTALDWAQRNGNPQMVALLSRQRPPFGTNPPPPI